MKTKSKNICRLSIACLLILTSPLVFAATSKIPWTGYLVIIVTVSLVTAFILSKRNKNAESLTVKILFGGMYFWVVTFVQLMVLSLIYYIDNK